MLLFDMPKRGDRSGSGGRQPSQVTVHDAALRQHGAPRYAAEMPTGRSLYRTATFGEQSARSTRQAAALIQNGSGRVFKADQRRFTRPATAPAGEFHRALEAERSSEISRSDIENFNSVYEMFDDLVPNHQTMQTEEDIQRYLRSIDVQEDNFPHYINLVRLMHTLKSFLTLYDRHRGNISQPELFAFVVRELMGGDFLDNFSIYLNQTFRCVNSANTGADIEGADGRGQRSLLPTEGSGEFTSILRIATKFKDLKRSLNERGRSQDVGIASLALVSVRSQFSRDAEDYIKKLDAVYELLIQLYSMKHVSLRNEIVKSAEFRRIFGYQRLTPDQASKRIGKKIEEIRTDYNNFVIDLAKILRISYLSVYNAIFKQDFEYPSVSRGVSEDYQRLTAIIQGLANKQVELDTKLCRFSDNFFKVLGSLIRRTDAANKLLILDLNHPTGSEPGTTTHMGLQQVRERFRLASGRVISGSDLVVNRCNLGDNNQFFSKYGTKIRRLDSILSLGRVESHPEFVFYEQYHSRAQERQPQIFASHRRLAHSSSGATAQDQWGREARDLLVRHGQIHLAEISAGLASPSRGDSLYDYVDGEVPGVAIAAAASGRGNTSFVTTRRRHTARLQQALLEDGGAEILIKKENVRASRRRSEFIGSLRKIDVKGKGFTDHFFGDGYISTQMINRSYLSNQSTLIKILNQNPPFITAKDKRDYSRENPIAVYIFLEGLSKRNFSLLNDSLKEFFVRRVRQYSDDYCFGRLPGYVQNYYHELATASPVRNGGDTRGDGEGEIERFEWMSPGEGASILSPVVGEAGERSLDPRVESLLSDGGGEVSRALRGKGRAATTTGLAAAASYGDHSAAVLGGGEEVRGPLDPRVESLMSDGGGDVSRALRGKGGAATTAGLAAAASYDDRAAAASGAGEEVRTPQKPSAAERDRRLAIERAIAIIEQKISASGEAATTTASRGEETTYSNQLVSLAEEHNVVLEQEGSKLVSAINQMPSTTFSNENPADIFKFFISISKEEFLSLNAFTRFCLVKSLLKDPTIITENEYRLIPEFVLESFFKTEISPEDAISYVNNADLHSSFTPQQIVLLLSQIPKGAILPKDGSEPNVSVSRVMEIITPDFLRRIAEFNGKYELHRVNEEFYVVYACKCSLDAIDQVPDNIFGEVFARAMLDYLPEGERANKISQRIFEIRNSAEEIEKRKVAEREAEREARRKEIESGRVSQYLGLPGATATLSAHEEVGDITLGDLRAVQEGRESAASDVGGADSEADRGSPQMQIYIPGRTSLSEGERRITLQIIDPDLISHLDADGAASAEEGEVRSSSRRKTIAPDGSRVSLEQVAEVAILSQMMFDKAELESEVRRLSAQREDAAQLALARQRIVELEAIVLQLSEHAQRDSGVGAGSSSPAAVRASGVSSGLDDGDSLSGADEVEAEAMLSELAGDETAAAKIARLEAVLAASMQREAEQAERVERAEKENAELRGQAQEMNRTRETLILDIISRIQIIFADPKNEDEIREIISETANDDDAKEEYISSTIQIFDDLEEQGSQIDKGPLEGVLQYIFDKRRLQDAEFSDHEISLDDLIQAAQALADFNLANTNMAAGELLESTRVSVEHVAKGALDSVEQVIVDRGMERIRDADARRQGTEASIGI